MNVVLMVSDGYPKKFSANNAKGEFIALGLQNAGCNVSMLDSLFGTKGQFSIESGVSDAGINYILLPRNNKYLAFIYNIPRIWKFLRGRKEKGGVNHIILGMTIFPFFVLLSLMAKIAGYKRSSLFHEWHTSIVKGNFIQKIFASMLDKKFGYFVDLIFPISHYLKDKSEQFGKPLYLLPVLASYNRVVNECCPKTHFTFCGHIRYLLRNKLILDAFRLIYRQENSACLTLVLVGNEDDFGKMRDLLEKDGLNKSVIVKSNLSQKDLYYLYDTSIALLVPLDPDNLQDKARFSQKIAEYVSSKRPIITSQAGEIPYYFKNKESALIVPYNAKGYADGMLELLKNPSLADSIGNGGYQTGIRYFDYRIVGKELKGIIEKL